LSEDRAPIETPTYRMAHQAFIRHDCAINSKRLRTRPLSSRVRYHRSHRRTSDRCCCRSGAVV